MSTKRIAIVTGGNRGIGLEICRQLAEHGMTVLLTARSAEKATAAADQLKNAGDVRARVLDVTDAASIDALVSETVAEFGRIDVLINNAGIHIDRGPVMATTADQLRQTYETNIIGPVLLMQAVIPVMQEHGYGRVVNVSSRMGSLTHMGRGSLSYRSSKSAINAATRVFSAEMAGDGVLINTCHPGWVRTDMGGPNASWSVEQGADTPVWLAMLPDDGPTGGFFFDRQPLEW